MALGAARQGGRRLGRAEQHAPGRRLARDRDHGRDRRLGPAERRSRGRPAAESRSLNGFHHALEVAAVIALVGAVDRAPRRSARSAHPRAGPASAAVGVEAGVSRARRPQPRAAAPGRGAAAGRARHGLPRLLREELPRRDDGRDRPRGGDHRADPLPPLRLEARPLPRLPRRGVAAASASSPRRRSQTNPAGCLGAIADAYMAKRAKLRLVDLWIQALTEASEDAVIAKARPPADPRGARLLRRRDPPRPGRRRRSTPTATRSPRRGSSSPAACSRRSTTGSAACSAATSSGVRASRRAWMTAGV